MAKKQIPYYEEADFIPEIDEAVAALSKKIGVKLSRNDFISMAVKNHIEFVNKSIKNWS